MEDPNDESSILADSVFEDVGGVQYVEHDLPESAPLRVDTTQPRIHSKAFGGLKQLWSDDLRQRWEILLEKFSKAFEISKSGLGPLNPHRFDHGL